MFSVSWIPTLYLKCDLQYFLPPVMYLFTMMFPMLYKNFGLMQSYLSTFLLLAVLLDYTLENQPDSFHLINFLVILFIAKP